jgi:hypothetical protein
MTPTSQATSTKSLPVVFYVVKLPTIVFNKIKPLHNCISEDRSTTETGNVLGASRWP